MAKHIPAMIITLFLVSGCMSSGKVSPLIYCSNPADINGRIFTNCTQPIGKESP